MSENNQPQPAAPGGKRNPNIWVPSLYYAQGFPLTAVTEMGQIFLKALNVPIEALGIFAGIFNLPWAFKFIWSPLVDLFGSKRTWILVMQSLLTLAFAAIAAIAFIPGVKETFSLHIVMPNPSNPWTVPLILLFLLSFAYILDAKRPMVVRSGFGLTAIASVVLFFAFKGKLLAANDLVLSTHIWILAAFFLTTAFFSATHDIAIDGYYLDVLDKDAQATYSGVRIAAYRVAMVVGSGLLVMLVRKPSDWGIAYGIGAAIFAALVLFHSWYLPAAPRNVRDASGDSGNKRSFVHAFTTYLDQKRVIAIILFILLYRIGDFLWKPMSKPFLMDIGVTVPQIGFLQGVIGIIATILGSILGGIYISKRGLTRGLWVLGIAQNATLLLYAYLAYAHKVVGLTKDGLPVQVISLTGLWHVGVINAFENFAYGLGTIAFVNFLMRTCKKEYTAAHYAIATGLMALATTIAGMFSGFIAKETGYMHYFIICFLCSIPGLAILLFLPLKDMEAAQKQG